MSIISDLKFCLCVDKRIFEKYLCTCGLGTGIAEQWCFTAPLWLNVLSTFVSGWVLLEMCFVAPVTSLC